MNAWGFFFSNSCKSQVGLGDKGGRERRKEGRKEAGNKVVSEVLSFSDCTEGLDDRSGL